MKPMSICRLLSVFVALACASLFQSRADSMGPASKRTALTISEVMYHPATRADAKNLEFIEIYNSENVPLDLSNYRIDGDISFTFPTNTTIAGLGFVVVGSAPADLKSVYNLTTVYGPFENNGVLPNDKGKIELWSRSGALLLEVEYNDSAPWPVAGDGSGHSIVLARPTYGQNSAKAWAQSWLKGGSPGALEPAGGDVYSPIVINEILAHTDDPIVDYIELYNHSNAAGDLTGCILTDDLDTNKFVIGSVSIPARGYVAFTQTQLGFALSAAGETIYLKNPTDTRVIDAVRFGGQENNVSFGRFPNGALEWHRLATKTPGAANDAIRQSQIVINELMYSPISGDDADQYVELYNSGATTVDLTGWTLGGGIGFNIPSGTTLAPNSYLVIANNAARLIPRYSNLTTNNTLGNFSGNLSGSSERITLAMPDTILSTNESGVISTTRIDIVVDEVTYGSGGRWTEWADGGGSSLELVDPRSDHRQPSNWAASDETQKAPWTTVEHTGVLDNGTGAADQLQMHLQGAGEVLVDNIEVIPNGGANLIANSTFETDAAGWTAQGTQDQSSLETTEGFQSARSYHLRAVDRGDTGANRIRTPLASPLTVGSTATIRAKVRWLRGHPEMLLRLRGNYLEAIGILNIPTNLGSPGARNSRAAANAGPAIYDVIHSPILPPAAQAITVTARVNDPDVPLTVQLNYRVDPATTFTATAMNDSGASGDTIAGDGIYTGTIPAQAAGAIVAFYVHATDSQSAETRFPNDAPTRQCYIRVGDTQPSGALGTYRLWMPAATVSKWATRGPLNNTPLDVTFVYGNERVIYNMEALYAGSPYIAPGYNGPTGGLCGYTGEFPKDDLFLGVNDFVLDWPGRDNAAISESISYYIADEAGLPNSHRRFIHLHVNGVTSNARGSVYEDVQQPGGDMIKEWSPGDEDGHFYKVERWFEFSDTTGLLSDPMPRLENYVTTGGAKKLARYRWNWLPRAVKGSVNDYDDIFAWVDAVNAAAPEPYTSQVEALMNVEEVMGMFAMERVINNFDSWGHQIGKNMYAYKPVDGRWMTFMFDNDWLMIPSDGFGTYNVNSPLFTPVEDPTVARMFNHPPFRRAFFRNIKRAVEAMDPAKLNPLMDAKYASLTSSGVTRSAGQTLVAPTAVKTWLAGRRSFLISQLNAIAAPFAITSNGGADFSTTTNVVTLSGTAPIDVMKIAVNGITYPVRWTTVTNWTMNVPIAASTRLDIAGLDRNNAAVGSGALTVTFTGTLESPEGRIVFNEIMYNPPMSGAGFIELRSLAANTTYDLSNWRIEGVGFTFPQGTLLPPGGYIVIAKDRAA
ncbi:MAG TPA: lamin tail domain-containing protein, partial [Verrucomicrobiae bacterium]|nr:lamin tail domain-containing protein [Verrucomicrobiae bacterium]